MGLMNISKRQLRAVDGAGRINTLSQARSFTYSCIQISESTFFGSSISIEWKALTHTHTLLELRFVVKAEFFSSTWNKPQKMLLEVRPQKNPHWSKHSARREHLHSLPTHPPRAQCEPCWSAESRFLTWEGTGKNSHWTAVLRTRSNATGLGKWLPVGPRWEPDLAHPCTGGCEINWVKSWLR